MTGDVSPQATPTADLRLAYLERLGRAQYGMESAVKANGPILRSLFKHSSNSTTPLNGVENAGQELVECVNRKVPQLQESIQSASFFPTHTIQNINKFLDVLEESIDGVRASMSGLHLTGRSIEKTIRECEQNIENAWNDLTFTLPPSALPGTPDTPLVEGLLKQSQSERPVWPFLQSESPKPKINDTVQKVDPSPQEEEAEDDSDGEAAWTKLLQPSRTILKYVGAATPLIPVVGQFIQCGVDVGNAIVDLLDGTIQNTQATRRLSNRVTRLSSMVDVFEKKERSYCSTELGIRHLKKFARICARLKADLIAFKSQHTTKKFILSNDNTAFINVCNGKIDDALEQLNLYLQLNADHMLNDLGEARLIDLLGDGHHGDRGYEKEDGFCLEGTREEVLFRLEAWAEGPSRSNVLLLKGQAGRGKSAIAKTAARRFVTRPGRGSSVAIFFFRRGEKGLNERPIRALARQLVRKGDPRLRNAILQALHDNQDVSFYSLEDQFRILLVGPLQKLHSDPPPVMLVIDALDECGEGAYCSSLLRIIAKYSPSLPATTKILVTSRPEQNIVPNFEAFMVKGQLEDLDAVKTDIIEKDLRAYFETRLSAIGRIRNLSPDWQGVGTIDRLVGMAQGLFQWATTAIEFIAQAPVTRLHKLLHSKPSVVGLPALYRQILEDAFPGNSEIRLKALIQHVLGSLVASPGPMSQTTLVYLWYRPTGDNQLIDVGPEIQDEVLNRLHSLLMIPALPEEPIQFFHTTVRDFLVNEEQCRDSLFFVDAAQHRHRLATACLERMERDLTGFDVGTICGPAQTSAEVRDTFRKTVPSGLVYCARSWFACLSQMPHDEACLGLLDDFCRTKLIHWIELLSLAEVAQEVIPMTQQGKDWIGHTETYAKIYELLGDAQRLCRRSFQIIATRPYHISRSVLLHCPLQTALRHFYTPGSGIPRIKRGPVHGNWPNNLWTKCVDAMVRGVAFSPDGRILASGAGDNTVRLWNVESGMQAGAAFIGHTNWVYSVAFSPDGKIIASGSADNTVRLWNIESGTQIGVALTGHTNWIRKVAFSPDGKIIASASSDQTVRLWNVEDATRISVVFTGHTEPVMSVAFSPDGKTAASGSCDKTVRLWNIENGTQIGTPLIGHTDWIRSVAFSPDGKTIASGSDDKTIRLWSAENRKRIGAALTGHNDWIIYVTFSLDGKTIVSGSDDKTIRFWNIENGKQIDEALTGHTDMVFSMASSPDGKIIVSSSKDKTIQLCNVETVTRVGAVLTGHTNRITSVAYSPDEKIIASGSVDYTIRLWGVEDGKQIGAALTGHTGPVLSMAFSRDGSTLVSGSEDMTIRLWNVDNGAQIGTALTDHMGSGILRVAFSHNGRTIVSGSDDKTFRIWNIINGIQIKQVAFYNVNDLPLFAPDMGPPAASKRQIKLHGSRSGVDMDGWVFRNGIRWFWLPREWYADSHVSLYGSVETLDMSLFNNILVIHHSHVHVLDVSGIM